jgi:hypothetical protein
MSSASKINRLLSNLCGGATTLEVVLEGLNVSYKRKSVKRDQSIRTR